ncbi:pyruvate dehydrogenase E2 component (dihydrolipoamide acetyltransferase) [Arthrobacter sp. AG367]|uniref:dihydrolipoamide acetyltransferase family protein n=1 Tax=Arthrobacter sp. AG367 TaxID=2572909 RepID=UPI0011A22796|nr:dihydrolipoamide acetyltransferase family protein [Arthrobacter sp. AG367]TWD53130.1 pyruvate dehydrogenase E2 component (dihydrolipoamide acetyltransferase) [Arthrobacter sp. AG367]
MSEPRVFLLPDLGEGLTEAELVSWHVAVGDEIAVDQPIAEVETAKSAVEVPSPYAGIVTELHGQPGETLDVGQPLISVTPVSSGAGVAADDAAPAPSPAQPEVQPTETELAEPKPANAAAEAYREEEKAGSGNVLIGYGTPGGHGVARRTRARKTAVALAEPAEPKPTEDDLTLLRTRVPGKLGAVISPLVRRMAREHGVDLGDISGSGDSGLIMRRDVEAALRTTAPVEAPAAKPEEAKAAETRPATAPREATPANGVDARTGLGIAARTPVRGVRKAVAANMARSRSEIPEATVWVDVDATALLELREGLKANGAEAPGLLAFIARFVTAGLKKYPELNTRIEAAEDGSQEIVAFDGVNLGFAAQTDRGLVVPSVRGAEKLSARELDGEIRRLTQVARDGKATPTELGSGTFTLNNYGVFGVDGSAAIINHPEVAILGVGRIIDKPWVVNGELAVRKVTELTLTFDHRVCDGGTAGGFLRFVADAIENPTSLLADI